VSFATAMPDANYVFIGHAGEVTNRITESASLLQNVPPTTTEFNFYTGYGGADGVPSTTPIDNGQVSFVVYT
jgi:hypothetical protein